MIVTMRTIFDICITESAAGVDDNDLRNNVLDNVTLYKCEACLDMLAIEYKTSLYETDARMVLEGFDEEELYNRYALITEEYEEKKKGIFRTIFDKILSLFRKIVGFFKGDWAEAERKANSIPDEEQPEMEVPVGIEDAAKKIDNAVGDLKNASGEVTAGKKGGIKKAMAALGIILSVSTAFFAIKQITKSGNKKTDEGEQKEEETATSQQGGGGETPAETGDGEGTPKKESVLENINFAVFYETDEPASNEQQASGTSEQNSSNATNPSGKTKRMKLKEVFKLGDIIGNAADFIQNLATKLKELWDTVKELGGKAVTKGAEFGGRLVNAINNRVEEVRKKKGGKPEETGQSTPANATQGGGGETPANAAKTDEAKKPAEQKPATPADATKQNETDTPADATNNTTKDAKFGSGMVNKAEQFRNRNNNNNDGKTPAAGTTSKKEEPKKEENINSSANTFKYMDYLCYTEADDGGSGEKKSLLDKLWEVAAQLSKVRDYLVIASRVVDGFSAAAEGSAKIGEDIKKPEHESVNDDLSQFSNDEIMLEIFDNVDEY